MITQGGTAPEAIKAGIPAGPSGGMCAGHAEPMNSFGTKDSLIAGSGAYSYHRLPVLDGRGVARLPYSLKILLENLLRYEDGSSVTSADVEAVLNWDPKASPSKEIAYRPARVLMQDFTGVPAVVDLAAMRGSDGGKWAVIPPRSIPSSPPIWSSTIQCRSTTSLPATPCRLTACLNISATGSDTSSSSGARTRSATSAWCPPRPESFTKSIWSSLRRLRSLTSATESAGSARTPLWALTPTQPWSTAWAFWGGGVGGIEAEAGMLGQPVSMLIPPVVGFELTGRLAEGATATDLVLTVVEMLRARGVVGKFVEFFGDGLDELPLADRATIANMGSGVRSDLRALSS